MVGRSAGRAADPTGGSAATTVVVLADTHLRRGWRRTLPPRACELLDAADVVLHAGDVQIPEALADLRARYGTVHAVLGNNDRELVGALPEELEVEIAGVRVALVHDSGPARGRAERLHRRFPFADVVVFGHSHIPLDGVGVDGQRLFNPGSPTERRRQPHATVGVLVLRDGAILDARIEVVDR